MDKQSAGYPYNKIRDSNKRNKLLILTTIWRKFLNIMLCWRHQTRVYNVSVQSSHSVASDSLRPHGPQHTRLPCPSPSPRVYPNWCPLSQWCHSTISSSVVPFSSCLQSFPASGSFPMSQFFTSGGHSIRASASASVLPMSIQLISFRMDLLDCLAVQETLKSLLQHHH